MSARRFVRGATTLKTQPVYAPGGSVGRARLHHPRILRATAANRAPRRAIKIPKGIWAGLAAVGVVALLGWLLLGSQLFRIQTIEIVGGVTDPVRQEIERLQGANILTYSTAGIEERLQTAQPSIQSLALSKGLPHTLRVEIALRQPVLQWQSGDERDLLDAQGIAFRYTEAQTTDAIAQLPLVVDTQRQAVAQGKMLVSRQFLTFLRRVDDTFRTQFPIPVDHYELGQSSFEVTLVTKDGWRAILDTTRQPEPELDALQQVFEHFHADIHEYVDLRIPGRAYFK